MEGAPIWVPPSHAFREATAVNAAVREYDPELQFGRNEANGQWCIFMERHGNRVPILGFREIPHPDDALKRLYQADTRRHGSKILDDLNKENQRIKAEKEHAVQEATGELADAAEYAAREDGLHPTPRIFVPKGV
jgi:hypothetical protein